MEDTTFNKFLMRCGRYYLPASQYYHHQLQQSLSQLGFKVLSVERYPHHPVWELRLKDTLTAQATLLLGKTSRRYRSDWQQPAGLLERRLKLRVRSILKELGPFVPSDSIVVVHSGCYWQAVFVWPVGQPGIWRRPAVQSDPLRLSLVFLRWLRAQRN